MSHSRLANVLKRNASALDSQAAEMRVGTIESIGPDGTTARVTIMPEGILSGWLPVGFASVGANCIIVPPNQGDLVLIEPHEGDAENWVISHRIFSTASPPPNSPATGNPIKPGELAIIMGCGSYLHFDVAGNVWGKAATQWNMVGNVKWTGTMDVTGEVTAGSGGADQVGLQTHTHTGTDSHGYGFTTNAPTAGT